MENGVGNNPTPFCIKRIKEKTLRLASAAAMARRRQDGGKCAVFIKAEQQSGDDGKPATVKDIRAERTVFRAEHEQSDKNPKGVVTLIATSHNKPPVLGRRGYVVSNTCGFYFLLHNIPNESLLCG